MKKSHMVLYIFLTLGIIVIIISIGITKQSLRELVKNNRPKILNASDHLPGAPVATEQQAAPVKIEKEKAEPQELEFDELDKISDDYVKAQNLENRKKEEESAPNETQLNKQPVWGELKELKAKGVIIY